MLDDPTARRRRIAEQSGPITKGHAIEQLLVGRENDVYVCYAPVDYIHESARIVFVGLTPGCQQAELAYGGFREGVRHSMSADAAMAAAKATASFAGMRKRLCGWLDELGAPSALGLESTTSLFSTDRALLHTTSVIMYPVL